MLEARRFLVRERVKIFRSHHTYDIYDADTEEQIGLADESISAVKQLMRWFVSKQLMGTRIEVREKPDDSLVFTISRAGYIFRSRVEVHDAQGTLVGYFKSKLVSWSGGFYVYDGNGRQFAEVKGNLTGFKYRILTPDGAVELGRVSKQWKGLTREIFTSADTYLVEINQDLDDQPLAKMLVLAAALATDMIFKSESRTSNVGAVGG
jgi:uncharacterized protein YxjI